MALIVLQKKKEKEEEKRDKTLQKKSSESNSAESAARTIRDDTIKKTEPQSRQIQSASQRYRVTESKYRKPTYNDKKTYKVGGYGAERGQGVKDLKRFSNLRDAFGVTNSGADAMKTIREARENGTQQTKQGGNRSKASLEKTNRNLFNNERHMAYADPETRAVAQEVFATNPAAKFLGNMSESFIDFSPIGMAYSATSGENIGTEMATKDPELYSRMNSGYSAMAGDLVGAALGTKVLDLPFNNWANNSAKTVLEGTKLGQKIRAGAVNGKIGQYIGKEAMNGRLEQFVADQILNSTVEAGQNLAAVYGEGYRGKDLLDETLKQTAFDMALGSAFSLGGLGANGLSVRRGAKKIGKESVESIIKASDTKSEYLNNLMNRLRAFNDAKYDSSGSRRIGDASAEKSKEYADEYRKVLRMTDEEFAIYKNGDTSGKAVKDTEIKGNNDALKSKSTGKNVRSPKSSKTTFEYSADKPSEDYTVTYGEPNESVYRINPKEYDFAEERVQRDGQARISIDDLENRAKQNVSNNNKPSANEEKPEVEATEQKAKRTIRSDGVTARASVNDFRDRLNNMDEISRFENIKREVRESFPEATAEEQEALETALRHNDNEAFAKAESAIRERLDSEKNSIQTLEYKPERYEPPKAEELKVAEDTPEIKTEEPKTEAKVEEPVTTVNAEPKSAESGKKKAPSARVQDAIDGKTDWHDLKVNEKAEYIRRQGGKVGRNDKTHAKLNKIGEDLEKAKSEPKIEKVKPAKETAKLPSELPSEKIENIRKLEAGTFVVHKNFGIGKFTGIEKVLGERKARVQFADSPSGNMSATYIALDKIDDYLKKYAGDDNPKLDQMTSKVGEAHFDDAAESSANRMTTEEGLEALRERRMSNNGKLEKKTDMSAETSEDLDDILETETSGVDIPKNDVKNTTATINNSDGGTYSLGDTSSKELPRKPKRLTKESGQKAIENNNNWKEKNLPKKSEVKSEEQTQKAKPNLETAKNKAKSDDPRKWGNDIDSIAEHYGRQKAEYVRGTQKGWNTYQNADITPAELQARMIEDNENHIRKYVSNKKILASAEEKASKDFDQMSSTFFGNANAGRATTSQDIADGYVLAREYIKNKDFDSAMKVYSELSTMESEVGRALQAQKLFRQLTPEGRLKSTISSIKRLEKARNMKFEIDTKLLDDLYNAGTEAEQLAAKKALALSVWNQVPVKFIEKLNAWRYLSMLGNLKTHNRNILGNLLLMPFRGISDGIATGIEKMGTGKLAKINLENTRARLNRLSNEELDGLAKMYNIDVKGSGKDGAKIKSDYVTALEKKYADQEAKGRHAILNPLSRNEAETRKIAKQEFKKLRQSIELGEMKFFDRGRMKESSIFKTKIIDKLEKLNTNMLEGEDVFFMRANFDNAFVEYCKANKLNPSDLDGKTLEKVVEYAYNEGLKGTYRDANSLADTINKIRKMAEVTSDDKGLKKIGKKAAGVAMDATMPFVKTPLNILKRGTLEYSPVGVLRGMLGDTGIFKAKNADDFLKSIDLISTGLTGTGTMVLGGLLASRGIVNGTLGEINDKTSYDKMLGKQNYAVNFAEDFPWEYLSGKSITLDWIAPESIPFFVGVETGTAMKNNNNTADAIGDFLMALSNISEPIFELSMLQGVENIFNTAFSEKGGLGQMARNAGYGYLSQLVPTLSGQATRTVTKDRQVALSTSSNSLTKEVQKQMGNIANKLPHINQLVNQDYVDQWGRTDSKLNWRDYRDSALENFIYPFYVSDNKVTDVDAEILRLYDSLDETDKNSVIPKFTSTAYNQKYNDKEYTMTPEQFTQYKKTVGQAKYQGLEKLFKTSEYKNASDEEKAKLISDVYSEANLKGKKEFLKEVDEEFAKAPDYYMMTKDQQAKWNSSLGFSKQAYATAYNAKLEANREKQAKYGKDLTDAEKMAVLREHGVTTIEQARAIDGNIGKTIFMKDEGAEEKWNEAFKTGESFQKVQSEVVAGYEAKAKAEEHLKSLNIAKGEEERAANLLAKYDGETVSPEAYDYYVRYVASNNANNPDESKRNGTYDTKEITYAIQKTTEEFGWTQLQQAYVFSTTAPSNWKNPYN